LNLIVEALAAIDKPRDAHTDRNRRPRVCALPGLRRPNRRAEQSSRAFDCRCGIVSPSAPDY
jgi:hypothetical protein